MADSELVNVTLKIEADNKPLRDIPKKFEKDMKDAVRSAFDLDKNVSIQITNLMKNSGKKFGSEVGGSMSDAFLKAWKANEKSFSTSVTRSLDGAISNLKSPKEFGQKVAKGFLTGVGKSGNILGSALSAKGKGKMSQSGKGNKAIGVLLRGLGPVVQIMSTLVGSLGSLISLLVDAEAQAKDFNRTLLDGGVAGGDLVQNLGDAGSQLELLREASVDFFNNAKWGTLAKDQLEIIAAYNEAGYTLKEMTQNTKNATEAMRAYQDVTKVALTYSKLLGMSTKEIASMQAGYMESMGASLGYIEGQFNAIYKTAQLSGFGVKRFTGMVQQATSGMAMYNVRIDEAAGLLQTLSGALSPEDAGKFLSTLNQGFAGEGMQDRFKRIMTTGQGKMKKIFQDSADDISFDFGKKLAGSMGSEAVMREFEGLGLDVNFDTAEGRKDVIKALGKLSPEEQARMLARVGDESKGGSKEISRELSKLMKISEGAAGGMDNMARNMGALDMGGVLAAQLNQMDAVLGKPLYKMNAKELAAFEAGTGISGEQLELLKEVDKTLHGNYEELKAQGKTSDTEEQIRQMEAFGAAMDENGKMFQAQIAEDGKSFVDGTRQEISSMGDYIQSRGDMIARATEVGLDKNTALAQEIARNTTEVAKVLEMGVQYWLEKIYQLIGPIASWVAEKMGGRKSADVQAELNQVTKDEDKLREGISGLQTALSGLRVELDTASGEEKDAIQAKITDIQSKIESAQIGLAKQAARREAVQASMFDADINTAENSASNVRSALSDVMGEDKYQAFEQQMVDNIKTAMADMGEEYVYDKATGKSNVDEALEEALAMVGSGMTGSRSKEDMLAIATSPAFIAQALRAQGSSRSYQDESGENLMDAFEKSAQNNTWIWKGASATDDAVEARASLDRMEAKGASVRGQRGAQVAEAREVGRAMVAHAETNGYADPSTWKEAFGLSEEQIGILNQLQHDGLTDQSFRELSGKELDQLIALKDLLPDKSVRDAEAKKYSEMVAKEITRAQLLQKGIAQLSGTSGWDVGEYTKKYQEMVRSVDAAVSGDAMAMHKLLTSGSEAQDFIYRPGSPPMKFSDQDTVVGFKKGGAFDNSKGQPNIQFNVYGSQGEIVATIKRVLNQYGFNT